MSSSSQSAASAAAATTTTSIITTQDQGAHYQILKKYPRLLEYIQQHLQDKVIHLYYGTKMMGKRAWRVVPYDFKMDNHIMQCLEALTLFTLQRNLVFILYNDASSGVIQVVKEYETSLRIPLDIDVYNKLKEIYPVLNTYMLFYYDDHIRMSNNQFQSKKVRRKKNLMKIIYYNGMVYMLPYTRTESNECMAALPESGKITAMICRRVIFDEAITNNSKMRVALEEMSDSGGLRLFLTAEIEYDQVSFYTYTENKIVEDAFFNRFVEMFMYYLKHLKTKDLMSFSPMNLINYGSRDFKELNKAYTPMHEVVVHKLDGYKCKFAVSNGMLTYLDAKQNCCTGLCSALNIFENVVFQGEVLENNVIVITDVLGGFVTGNDLHMPQPLEIYPFFDWVREYNESDTFEMVLYNHPVVTFTVYLQHVIDVNADVPSPFKTDGYIIIQNANIFKFKIPTIDVIADNGYLKVSGRAEPITDEHFKDLVNGAIYEVQQNKDRGYFIVRMRFDRNIPCDENQFNSYLNELTYMRGCIRASTLEDAKLELKVVNTKVSLYKKQKFDME